MRVIYLKEISNCVFVCGWWHAICIDHLPCWLDDDVTYSSLCEAWTMRKRVFFLFRVKHECAFPERSFCCARCWTERLCGQMYNADPFALLSLSQRDHFFQQGGKERWLRVSNNIPTLCKLLRWLWEKSFVKARVAAKRDRSFLWQKSHKSG